MPNKRVVIFGWASSVHVQRWSRALTQRGYDIRIISMGGEALDDIDTIVFPRENQLSYFKYAESAAQKALEFKPDLIHVHYAGGFGIWGMKTKFKPTIVSVWGADVIDLPKSIFYRIFIKQSLKRADYITATSRMLKKTTLKLSKHVENKIKVIPFGVAIPDQLYSLPDDDKIKICYIKGHRYKYGPDILLQALAQVKDKIPKIKLALAGEGEITGKLKAMVNDLDLNDNVTFAGFIDNHKIYDFLKEHHFMVMPSVMDSESFGVAVLEASACGRPVIASKIGGVPEVLQHENTGLLVEPKNVEQLSEAIIKLASDINLMKKYGEQGYRFAAENYRWEKNVDDMALLYERLIDENKK